MDTALTHTRVGTTKFITEEHAYDVPTPTRPLPALSHDGLQYGIVPWSYFNVSEQELGEGAFGKVYAGFVMSERSKSWTQAAIKVLKRK